MTIVIWFGLCWIRDMGATSNTQNYVADYEKNLNKNSTYIYFKPGKKFYYPDLYNTVKLLVCSKMSHSPQDLRTDSQWKRQRGNYKKDTKLLCTIGLRSCDYIIIISVSIF